LRIFNLLHYGHNPQVAALCLALLGVAALPLAVWSAWAKWPALRRARRLAAAGIGAGLPLLLAGCSAGPPAGETLESRLFSRAEVLGSRGTAPGLFNKPRSLALDAQDNLYVVDLTGRVQKFGPDGNYSLCWQMPETDLGKPKGMGMDGQGRIVTIEPHYGRVNHFLPGGALAAQWGVRGTNAGQLFFPRAVAANSRGELWISEYGAVERIQKFAPGGTKLLATLGTAGEGPGEFNRAEGLGVDRADRLLVADSCNHRVQVFSPEGRWLAAFGKAGAGKGELSYPYDVRVDASGCIFVCEFGNSRIQIFDAHYRPLEIVGGPGTAPGRFANPWSMAFDRAGNLYVADAGNHRVQKLVRRPVAEASGAAARAARVLRTRGEVPG
jgi:DNA-binding beta-propeller fold protein YncE